MGIDRNLYQWRIEELLRARQSNPSSVVGPLNPSCPADISGVKFDTIPHRGQDVTVCATYERALSTGLLPDAETCPQCPYNTTSLRAEADTDLAESIAPFMKRMITKG